MVLCESNCSLSDGVIYGTSIYDDNSPICKAGIHAGVIDNTGGYMTVKLGHAHKNF
ncbi:MAG: LCCL domain-containing protein [bacterium]